VPRYKPHNIELETKMRPFIPDYIPAVGDIDPFVKVPRPDGKADNLGLDKLDEPAAVQSDPNVLQLQLRAVSKSSGAQVEPPVLRTLTLTLTLTPTLAPNLGSQP
jgi:intraflagellar transport protein 46